MKLKVLGCAAIAVLAGSAQAATVQDAMTEFGMIGVWADDCGRPPAGDNEYATYRLSPDGTVSLVYSNAPGEEGNSYTWTDAAILGPHFLWVKGAFHGNGMEQYSIVEMRDMRMRVWSNIDSSGRVLVEQGAFPGGGAPGWSQKCSR